MRRVQTMHSQTPHCSRKPVSMQQQAEGSEQAAAGKQAAAAVDEQASSRGEKAAVGKISSRDLSVVFCSVDMKNKNSFFYPRYFAL